MNKRAQSGMKFAIRRAELNGTARAQGPRRRECLLAPILSNMYGYAGEKGRSAAKDGEKELPKIHKFDRIYMNTKD